MQVLICALKKKSENRVEKNLFGKGISRQDRRSTGEQKKGLEETPKPFTTWCAWRDSDPRIQSPIHLNITQHRMIINQQ